MVNGVQYLPEDLRPPSDHKQEVLTFLALGHGDGHDSKRVLLALLADDDDFEIDGDDVETVTQEPAVETQG
jgi:uncharacterized caspase-like protein